MFDSAAGRDGDTLVVTVRQTEANGLVSLEMRRPDGGRLPDWTPGAHIDLILDGGLTRQYSLCGDPADSSRYRVAVLREPGGRGGSLQIHDQLESGATVRFGGPRNNFSLVPAKHYSFLAGGVGVTAILPMLRVAGELGAEWRLLYLGSSRESMGFVDELSQWGDRVIVHAVADHAGGHADVASWIGSAPPESKLYICGPARLLDTVEECTSEWRRGWVRMERFDARQATDAARTTSFDIELRESGLVVTVPPDVSVAAALRSAGHPVLTSCGKGVCGTCETSVLGGLPDHRDSLLDDVERESNTCMFPCVSRSLSDRLVLDL